MSEEHLVITKKDERAVLRLIVQVLSDNGILSEHERDWILTESEVL